MLNDFSVFIKQTNKITQAQLETLLYENKVRNVKAVNNHYGKFEICFTAGSADALRSIVIAMKQLNGFLPKGTITKVKCDTIEKNTMAAINDIVKTVNWLTLAEDNDSPAVLEVRTLLENILDKNKSDFINEF